MLNLRGNPKAIISLDFEDWFHLDYLRSNKRRCSKLSSALDGANVFLDICMQAGIAGTVFVVGEIARKNREILNLFLKAGFEIGSHGWSHTRPLELTLGKFSDELKRTRETLEEIAQQKIMGFRAPCFSLDDARLELVQKTHAGYDASGIRFSQHKLYGSLSLSGYRRLKPGVFQNGGFFEFEMSTLELSALNLPFSGGAYFRILPFPLLRFLHQVVARRNGWICTYFHPYEMSSLPRIPLLPCEPFRNRMRAEVCRSSCPKKLTRIIGFFKKSKIQCLSFRDYRELLLVGSG